MKIFRLLFGLLFFILIVTIGLSFMLPTNQKAEHAIEINATAPVIYSQLIKLENFNRFAVWTQQDSSAIYTLTGSDGTVGATSSWNGSPEISGKGKIAIVELVANKKVVHQLEFTEPRKMKAGSEFSLLETNPGKTTVTWTFKLATPRPWNIFNLFYSINKEKEQDFKDGLQALKKLIELSNPVP